MLNFCRRTLAGKQTTKQTAQPKVPASSDQVGNTTTVQRAAGASVLPNVKRFTRDQHSISRKQISPNALKVLYRLKDAGYDAYLVGGCIRDLLLGQQPKDFDIATNAHPEQIKQVFRNCRLIGRRFRLAHIMFGREIIEVATFRGHHSGADDDEEVAPKHKTASLSDKGQILRDNVYGSIEEDAERRDFTINALYYSVNDFAVYDFANGVEAIKQRKIELIGDPETRYREDPVRILRAIRFATKLNMHIAPDTAAPISQLAVMLKEVPAPRLFDELVKMFLAGKAFDNFMLMREMRVLRQLLPLLDKTLNQEPEGKAFLLATKALQSTDARIAENKPVTPAFIFAALLWYPIEIRSQSLMIDSGLNELDALNIAITDILAEVQRTIAIPKRFSLTMRDIWLLQHRLTKRAGRRAYKLLEHPKFRAGFDFLQLRAEAEAGDLTELSLWWERFQFANEGEKNILMQQIAKAGGSKKPARRKSYKRKPSVEK